MVASGRIAAKMPGPSRFPFCDNCGTV